MIILHVASSTSLLIVKKTNPEHLNTSKIAINGFQRLERLRVGPDSVVAQYCFARCTVSRSANTEMFSVPTQYRACVCASHIGGI